MVMIPGDLSEMHNLAIFSVIALFLAFRELTPDIW